MALGQSDLVEPPGGVQDAKNGSSQRKEKWLLMLDPTKLVGLGYAKY